MDFLTLHPVSFTRALFSTVDIRKRGILIVIN
uniref:Uncharacterized protein n=1 Tax=Siphoviridae sp. ct2u94 TaxID=2826277 RepID=A0A8S5QVN3_9CAUD|nr:MAG TPA: hypothetical protein [Siphoviridae sp. ct2u94]